MADKSLKRKREDDHVVPTEKNFKLNSLKEKSKPDDDSNEVKKNVFAIMMQKSISDINKKVENDIVITTPTHVASWNVHGTFVKKLDALKNLLEKEQFHILCLQEVCLAAKTKYKHDFNKCPDLPREREKVHIDFELKQNNEHFHQS